MKASHWKEVRTDQFLGTSIPAKSYNADVKKDETEEKESKFN